MEEFVFVGTPRKPPPTAEGEYAPAGPFERAAMSMEEETFEAAAPFLETDEQFEPMISRPTEITPGTVIEQGKRIFKQSASGLVGGGSGYLKYLHSITGGRTGGEEIIDRMDQLEKSLRPTGSAPLPGGGYMEELGGQFSRSLGMGAAGAGAGALVTGGPWGIGIGFALSGANVAGGAEYYDFNKGIENMLRERGATEEQIERGLKIVSKFAVGRAAWETIGELISNLSALIPVLRTGAPAAKTAAAAAAKPIISRINAAILNYGKLFAKAAPGELTGEELTTWRQYEAEGAAYEALRDQFPELKLPPIQSLWDQFVQTGKLTAGQTALHLLLFKGFIRAGKKRKEDIPAAGAPTAAPATGTAKELIEKYQIGGQTAAPVTEKIVEAPIPSIDAAISSLDGAVKKKQAKKVEKKVPKKAAKIIERILEPEEAVRPTPTISAVIAPSMYEDIAAPAQRVAEDLGIPITELTTDQFIEKTGVDLDKAKVSILAAIRLEKGWAEQPTTETVPSPAPVAPEVVRPTPVGLAEERVLQGTTALELKDGRIVVGKPGQLHFQVAEDNEITFDEVVSIGFVNAAGEYNARTTRPTVAPGEAVDIFAPTPEEKARLIVEPSTLEAEKVEKEYREYIKKYNSVDEQTKRLPKAPIIKLADGTVIKGERGLLHFQVAEQSGVDFDKVVDRGHVDSNGEITWLGKPDMVEKAALIAEGATEGQAIEGKIEPQQPFVEKFNVLSKAQQDELVSKAKKNPEFYKFIQRMVDPRGEAATAEEFVAFEGVDELFQEIGISEAQRVAAVKAIGLKEGYWDAEGLILDRFGSSLDLDGAISAEFDQLVDNGRAVELENSGLTDDQVDSQLIKEATDIVEAKLQDMAGSILSEKNESEESQLLADETQATVEDSIETLTATKEQTSKQEEIAGEPVVYTTKSEALAARRKMDNAKDLAVVGSRGKWTIESRRPKVKTKETAKAESVLSVTKHSLYMTKSQIDAAVSAFKKIGTAPDRTTNPEGYLDVMKVAINNAYHNDQSIGEVWPPLRSVIVDLKEQSNRFTFDRRSAEDLLKYARDIADFGEKVAAAVSEGKRYSPPPRVSVKERMADQDLFWKIRKAVKAEGVEGSISASRMMELMRNDPACGTFESKMFSAILANPTLRATTDATKVQTAGFYAGLSYYNLDTDTITLTSGSALAGTFSNTAWHEVMHPLCRQALLHSSAWNQEIDRLRAAALSAVPQVDRLVVASLEAKDFRTAEGLRQVRKLIQHKELLPVYYGLTDNFEFTSMCIGNEDMQIFLEALPPTEAPRTRHMSSLLRQVFYNVRRYVFGDTDEELRRMPQNYTLLTEAIITTTKMIESTTQKNIGEVEAIDHFGVRSAILNESPRPMKHGMDEIMDAIKSGEIHLPPRPRRDATTFEQIFMSPEAIRAVKENPLAYKMVGMCIDACDEHIYRRALGLEEVDRIFEKTTKQERLDATAALRRYEDGAAVADMTLAPKVRQIVENTIELKESYRSRMQDSMIAQLIRNSSTTEQLIFQDVLVNGLDATEATKKWNAYARKQNKARSNALKQGAISLPDKVPVTTYATMKSLFDKYKEYSEWGYDNYITRAMRGDIVVVDEGNRVITVGQTTKQVVERCIEYLNNLRTSLQSDEDIPSELFITTDFHLDKDAPLLVSPKRYQVAKGHIVKAMKVEAAAIQAELDKAAAEKVLRGVIGIKPKQIWTPFTEERHDILLGEEDISEVLPLYVHMMEKKIAFDPYISFHRKNINQIKGQPGVRKVIEDQLEASRGKYWALDRAADQIMETLGIQIARAKVKLYGLFGKEIPEIPPAFTQVPFSATRVIRQARQVMAKAKLGYRPIAAIVNLASGLGHAWVKTGAPYMLNAIKVLRTEEGQAFIKRYAPDLGTSLSAEESGQVRTSAKFWQSLGMFQAAEIPNREMSFVATYLLSRDQGMDERAAVEAAKRGVRLQEFNYNIASIPKILRGPGGRLIGQFKTYLIKELEFIRTLTPGEWVKYMAMHIALGGPRGLMITLKSLPPLIAVNAAINGLKGDGDDWLESIDEYLNVHLPRASRGIFGYFGVDASAPASFQFPQQWNDWAGVTISEVVNFAKEVAIPFSHGTKYVKWNLYDWSKGVAPIWKSYSDLIDSFYHDGWLWDDKGNKKYKVDSFSDKMRLALGMKPLAQSVAELQNRILANEQKLEAERVQNVIENAVRQRHSLGDDGVVNEIAKDCLTYQVMPNTLIAAIERSEMDPLLKRTVKSRLSQRLRTFQARQAVEKAVGRKR